MSKTVTTMPMLMPTCEMPPWGRSARAEQQSVPDVVSFETRNRNMLRPETEDFLGPNKPYPSVAWNNYII
jgi:hypothetical protein